jgi:hypothetical protein
LAIDKVFLVLDSELCWRKWSVCFVGV